MIFVSQSLTTLCFVSSTRAASFLYLSSEPQTATFAAATFDSSVESNELDTKKSLLFNATVASSITASRDVVSAALKFVFNANFAATRSSAFF